MNGKPAALRRLGERRTFSVFDEYCYGSTCFEPQVVVNNGVEHCRCRRLVEHPGCPESDLGGRGIDCLEDYIRVSRNRRLEGWVLA